ncbi:MAG: hypothetical protein ACFFEE_00690 [Candidatus Thorarchaeota archaeon]
MKNRTNKNTFSIELRSKKLLCLNLPKDVQDPVVIEGTLGNLLTLEFVEGVMLELKGSDGVLRMDITKAEWDHLLKKGSGE